MKYELWSMRNCFACEFTKDVLEENNIEFTVKYLHEDFTMRDIKAKTNKAEFPSVFLDGEYIGGVDWVSNLIKKEDK